MKLFIACAYYSLCGEISDPLFEIRSWYWSKLWLDRIVSKQLKNSTVLYQGYSYSSTIPCVTYLWLLLLQKGQNATCHTISNLTAQLVPELHNTLAHTKLTLFVTAVWGHLFGLSSHPWVIEGTGKITLSCLWCDRLCSHIIYSPKSSQKREGMSSIRLTLADAASVKGKTGSCGKISWGCGLLQMSLHCFCIWSWTVFLDMYWSLRGRDTCPWHMHILTHPRSHSSKAAFLSGVLVDWASI